MAIATRKKDPNAKRKYSINWTRWLASQSVDEVIDDSEWIVPSGLNKIDEGFTSKITTIWLTGGTEGATYTVVNRITTSVGQIQDASFELFVEQQ